MAKDYTITTDTLFRVWNEQTGACYEVMPDGDGVGLVQINVYSEGVHGKTPDTTVFMMPEEAEAVGAVILEAAQHARAVAAQIEAEFKS